MGGGPLLRLGSVAQALGFLPGRLGSVDVGRVLGAWWDVCHGGACTALATPHDGAGDRQRRVVAAESLASVRLASVSSQSPLVAP